MITIDIVVQSSELTSQILRACLPLELGRQTVDETLLTVQKHENQSFRIAIAPIHMLWIPRRALRLDNNGDGQLKITNIHDKSSFHVGDENKVVRPGESITTPVAVTLTLPQQVTLAIRPHSTGVPDSGAAQEKDEQESAVQDASIRTLDSIRSGAPDGTSAAGLRHLRSGSGQRGACEAAVDLVRQALTVVQKAAGSNEFFEAAVRATATMIELDSAYIILRLQNRWGIRSKYRADTDNAVNFDVHRCSEPLPGGSSSILEKVLSSKKTVIFEPNGSFESVRASMLILDRAVAAPMLDADGEVIGVVYGDRRLSSNRHNEPIGEFEATLLEVMASAVATGLARQREESLHTAMTQFFSPAVIESLRKNENLLAGRDAEVTVLFCDIRGFSAVSERIGPSRTIAWINDVLTELSECVIANDGVLVDYIGDEMMAMWGAPADQPDHAIRACRAAAEMLNQIEPLRQKWDQLTPDGFGLGIGINTGVAQVGNTGSKVKFKYGPLGNTVNVASRIQGMTKAFGVTVILTSSTQAELKKRQTPELKSVFQTRRLADARPLGIKGVTTLYEFQPDAEPIWQQMRDRYEKALDCFHNSDLTGAAKELASLVYDHPDDSPSVLLLGRVVEALTKHKSNVDPVMVFKQK